MTASDIYVRGGPGSAYLPVGRLVAGDLVVPVNRSASGTWVMIQYSRGFGWICRDLARWIEDIDALPTLDETDLTPTSLYTETPVSAPTGYQVNAGAEGAFVRLVPASITRSSARLSPAITSSRSGATSRATGC